MPRNRGEEGPPSGFGFPPKGSSHAKVGGVKRKDSGPQGIARAGAFMNKGGASVAAGLGSSAAASTGSSAGKNRFAGTTSDDVKAPSAPVKGVKITTPSVKAKAVAKPASKGATSGSITKPSKSFSKGREELGRFYLQATERMNVHERPKKK